MTNRTSLSEDQGLKSKPASNAGTPEKTKQVETHNGTVSII